MDGGPAAAQRGGTATQWKTWWVRGHGRREEHRQRGAVSRGARERGKTCGGAGRVAQMVREPA
jgi:hypothetical protein